MKFLEEIKGIRTQLLEIAYQLKRNANEAEKHTEYLNKLDKYGIGGFRIDANGPTISSAILNVQNKVDMLPTEKTTQNMIEREIEYHDKLNKLHKEEPDLLELINLILNKYTNMDKYQILDIVEILKNEYIVYKSKKADD